MLSGHKVACDRAATVAADMGFRATPLVVAGAFHSPLMQPAADRLSQALAKAAIRVPRAPVISNVTAQAHDSESSIRTRLVEQLTSPVTLVAVVPVAGERNVKAEFHELAPGKTLAGLMRRIDKNVKVITHDEPDQA
ncbi:MAG: hypothetical protein V9F04_01220 [Dermatophilaceae bacterium]